MVDNLSDFVKDHAYNKANLDMYLSDEYNNASENLGSRLKKFYGNNNRNVSQTAIYNFLSDVVLNYNSLADIFEEFRKKRKDALIKEWMSTKPIFMKPHISETFSNKGGVNNKPISVFFISFVNRFNSSKKASFSLIPRKSRNPYQVL